MFMRSLEVHLFETDSDLDSAIASGAVLPEQLIRTVCIDCQGPVGFAGLEFEPFVVVIDENDQDWLACTDCAKAILNYVDTFFPPVTKSHFAHHLTDDEEFDAF